MSVTISDHMICASPSSCYYFKLLQFRLTVLPPTRTDIVNGLPLISKFVHSFTLHKIKLLIEHHLGWIPRNFKIFNFKPKLSFLSENHINDNWVELSDFFEFTLYMTFAIFLKMAISTMAIFLKNFKNHIQGEFVKIRQFTLAIILVIFTQD